MFQLLYVSGASKPLADTDIDQILATSRKNNRHLDVTGMLLFAEGAFIQILEGEEKTVKALAERISRDPRHRNYMVLYEFEAETRAFADWQMGFRRLDPSRSTDAGVFAATRGALDARIGKDDGGLLFETVLAFGRDFVES